jgi:hypothetical protein
MGQEGVLMAYDAVYRGTITNPVDPEGLGRVKALVPQVLGQAETSWAWPVTPNIAGITQLAVGDPVWISFEGGDPDHPVWLGTWTIAGAVLDPLPVDVSQASQFLDADALRWMTRVTS